MPTALWIAHVQVTDAEAYGRYAALAGTALAAYGGVFVGINPQRLCVSLRPLPGGVDRGSKLCHGHSARASRRAKVLQPSPRLREVCAQAKAAYSFRLFLAH